MKSLRLRVVLIWLSYLIIGVGWLTSLIRYEAVLWAVVVCAYASVAMRWLPPAFPKRQLRSQTLWIVWPLLAVLAFAQFMFGHLQILAAGFWAVVVIAFAFQAYEDMRAWKTEQVDHVV